MEVERDAEYFDYLAGLSDTHLHRVFLLAGMCFAPAKLREKSKKGASALFLVVLRGIAKGQGLPREPSEAVRAGKGGTTKRTRPAACGRVSDVKFVPTQIPLWRLLFTASGFFFAAQRKRG